jgi:hypothetical protein
MQLGALQHFGRNIAEYISISVKEDCKDRLNGYRTLAP